MQALAILGGKDSLYFRNRYEQRSTVDQSSFSRVFLLYLQPLLDALLLQSLHHALSKFPL